MRMLRYCLREAGLGMRRNPFLSLATVLTAAIAMFVLSVFLLSAANLSNLIDFVERQVQVAIYLQDEVSESARDALIAKVAALDGVTDTTFVTREEALARLRAAFGDNAALLEGVEEFNPLRDAVEVRVAQAVAVDRVVEAVKDSPAVADISYGRELVARLVSVTSVLRMGVLGLAGLLGLATLFLIQNSVRLSVFARRDEVNIMRLVGATDGVIRWPFVFEGMTLACAGAAVAALSAALVYTWVWRLAGTHLAFLPVLPAGPLMGLLVPLLILSGALIGALGSVLALRRWLRD